MNNRKVKRSIPATDSLKAAVAQLREKVERGEVNAQELTQTAAFFRMILGNDVPLVNAVWRLSQLARAYDAGIVTVEEYQDKLEGLLQEIQI